VAIFYLSTLVILSGVTTVLGVIFVLATVRDTDGVQASPSKITISADVPPEIDQCAVKLSEDTCTYDLAASALSSQVITHTPFTMGGVTFKAPNGTFGLPYGALKHFGRTVNESIFGDQKRQYCLPVLNRKLVSCVRDDTKVYYDPGPLYLDPGFVLPITIDPNARTSTYDYRRLEHRLLTVNGTMVVAQLLNPAESQITVIAATEEYADILSYLMTGKPSPPAKSGPEMLHKQFTVACEMYDVSQQGHSTWKWTSLILDSGVMSAEIGTDDCTSAMEESLTYQSTGFANLPLAIEATTKILGGIDGYSKLINYDSFSTAFSQLTIEQAMAYAREADMNLLESLLSQMLGIVHTSWTAIVGDDDERLGVPILQRDFPHHYVIKTFWTPTTIVAVVITGLILLTTVWQAIGWYLAVRMLGKDREKQGWQLLDAEDLMEYTTLAVDDLRTRPETGAGRQKWRREFVLKEYERRLPVLEASRTEDESAESSVSSPVDVEKGMEISKIEEKDKEA
jgi:hypothetical protein